MKNYIEINKNAWNIKTDAHINSEFYDLEGFKKGNTSLNKIELDLLGDISGKKMLHLQCHFGQDSISMARMRAKVTGVDLSPNSIQKGEELARQLGEEVRFIESDVLKLSEKHSEKYDFVFASYGVLGWHPSASDWFAEAAKFIAEGGKLILVEFHPIIWIHDGKMENVVYSWFNEEAIVDESEGTYADRSAKINYQEVGWNHSFEDIIMGALKADLKVESFKEYNYSPYNVFADMEQVGEKMYRFKKFGTKLPLVYSLVLSKKK